MAGHWNYRIIPPIKGMIAKATHTKVGNVHTLDLVVTWVNKDLELCMGLVHSSFSLPEQREEELLNEAITKGELLAGAPWIVDPEDISLICGSFD